MAKDKSVVIEGEVVDDSFSLSGGLVPIPVEEEVVNVPGLTSNEPPDFGPAWIKLDQDRGGFNIEGEHVDRLVCCIFALKPTYTRFERDENGDPVLGRPLCKSLDRVHGTGDPGGNCAKCAKKEWPEKKGAKPDCSHTAELLLARDAGRPMPEGAYLRVKGMSVNPALQYVRKLGRKYTNNLWRALTIITTVPEKYQQTKTYYVAAFEQVEGKDFLEVPAIQPALIQLKAQLEEGFVLFATEHDDTDDGDAERSF